MNNVEWRVGAVSATTVYHDLCVDNCLVQDHWIAEYYMDGVKYYQYTNVPPKSGGVQQRFPLRESFEQAKADAAMYFANKELER